MSRAASSFFQSVAEPGAGVLPVPVRHGAGEPEQVARLLNRQPAEQVQLGDACGVGVLGSEPGQHFIEGKEQVGVLGQGAGVVKQFEPDPAFPTVSFPNPEEPGALDLALARARQSGADLVIANDPDGDRLAVAVPDPQAAGGWRALTGDQIGALLGAYILERTSPGPDPEHRLVATTVVSSTLLSSIAAAAGA